jgi:transcriptional regulator with XRE-family HTH domain
VPRTTIDMQREEAKRIGQRLRWVREVVNATPTEIAADIGVDSTAIRQIERGARLPSIHTLMALCHVLHISPQYLLWGTLEAVDPELAAQLKRLHPELHWPSAAPTPDNMRNSSLSNAPKPKTRARSHAVTAS